jgi:Tfp pilus assembly protein PilX
MRSLNNLKNNKGFILILTYLLIVTLAILGTAFFSRSTSERKIANVDKDNILAANIAEAGINRVIAYLRVNQPSADLDAPFDPFSGTQTLCAEASLSNCASSTSASGTYSASIDPADDNHQHPTSSRFTITVTATVGQISRTLSTIVQTDNFARFAYFSDNEHYGKGERHPVWFISGDTITGPTHTNGHFHIAGSPVFNDRVASVDDYLTYYHTPPNPTSPPDNPQFLGGLTLGTEPINMPNQAIALHTASVQGGMVLNGDSIIVLNSNGTMKITNSQYSTQHACNPCDGVALPTNNALYVSGGNLTLSGTLSGSLTVGTNRDIIINDNVKYSKVPLNSTFCPAGSVDNVTLANDGSGRLCSSSASTLGIVAEKQVIVSSSAPYNVEIDGSIMAMDRSFMVENWNLDSDSGTGGIQHKGTLKIFGGIIQNQRGPVGTFNSETNSISTGYSKNYIYDSRFAASPPPYFPQTGDYLKLVWQENLGFEYYNAPGPDVPLINE